MDTQSPRIRLDLTDEQRQQIKSLSGKDVSSLDLTIEELEARIAPESVSFNFSQIRN
jgi:hypothetical protein